MIRAWSEPDPTMNSSSRTRPFAELTFRASETHFVLNNISRSGYLPKIDRILRRNTPRSPNTAPATLNDSHDWFPSHMKPHLQGAEQQASPSNLTNTAPATQDCIPKSKRNCPKTDEVSFAMHDRFEHDPTMIRTRINLTEYCACHQKWHCNITKDCACHEKWN